MDTKGDELGLVRDRLRNAVWRYAQWMWELSMLQQWFLMSLANRYSPRYPPTKIEKMENETAGAAIARMANALRRFLIAECEAGRVSGILGLGERGTSLITTAMRALPIGLQSLWFPQSPA